MMRAVSCSVHLNLTAVSKAGDPYTGTTVLAFQPGSELDGDSSSSNLNALLFHADCSLINITGIKVSQGKRQLKSSTDRSDPTGVVKLTLEDAASTFASQLEVVVAFAGRIRTAKEPQHGLYFIPPSTLATFFEVTHCRSAFPCVDAPTERLRWQITLQLPGKGALDKGCVLGNTYPTEDSSTGNSRTVVFAPTAPLPAYAVGLYTSGAETAVLSATVDVDGGRRQLPLRAFGVGRTSFPLQLALDTMRRAVQLLEDFFGALPPPLVKLDLVAVPSMPIGGMEHDGLIFINEAAGIPKKGGNKKVEPDIIELVVHEVAHHWIGNYVGMPFTAKEGLCQIFEQCFGDVCQGKPMRRLKSRTAQAKVAGEAIGAEVKEGTELTGPTYQAALAAVHDFVAVLGWPTFQQGMRLLVETHGGNYVTQAELEACFCNLK